MSTPAPSPARPSRHALRRTIPGAALVLALALVGVVAAQGHAGDRRQQARPVPVGQPQLLARIPLAEAQAQVPFPIRLPARLPPGLTPRGVIVAPGPSADGVPGPPQVDVGYGAADRPAAGLHIQETLGSVDGGYVVDATKAQHVTVNAGPAIYAPGAWQKDGGWDEHLDSAILSWQAGGMTYVLQFSGLGLTRDDLVAIAASIQ